MVVYIPRPGTAIGKIETELRGCTLSGDWMSHLAYVNEHVECQLMTETDLHGEITDYVITVYDDRLDEPTVSRERVRVAEEALATFHRRLGEALMNEVMES